MIYLELLAVAVALFIVLRFVSSYFPVVCGKQKIRLIFLKVFPFIELLLWFSFIFWAINKVFIDLPYYRILTGSIIVVIVSIFGWYFLRDFVSGIILKAENAFEKGQPIHIDQISGSIKKLGHRSMQIHTGEGEYVKIPYSVLSAKNIVKPADTGNWHEHVIILKIPSHIHPEKIINLLNKRLIEMPWIISGEHININISHDQAGNFLAEIHLQSINPEMSIKTELILQSFVNEVFV